MFMLLVLKQFTLDTNYSAPATFDFGTQQIFAKLAAAVEVADQVADDVNDGKTQGRKRRSSVLSILKNILMLKSLHQPKQARLSNNPVLEQPRGNPCSNPL
ncbi:hypothetical protein YC2023_065046 [Brassica napus]